MHKIRFGIVGTGNIAHRFANAVNNTKNAELAAVASRTAAGAEAFGSEFSVPPMQTLRIIGLSDAIRKTAGVVYPQDRA